MQSNPGLTFETLDKKAGFLITTPSNNSVEVLFEDAPDAFFVAQTPQALILMASDDIRVTAFTSDSNVVLYFHKDSSVPRSFSIEITGADIEIKDSSNPVLTINGSKIFIDMEDCTIATHNQNSITIMMSDADAKIEFSTQVATEAVALRNVSMQSVDSNRLLIPASKRIPEFIISIYDDASFQRPRPSRFGVPVISTVPGFIPDSSWNISVPVVDQDLMEIGAGTETRTMYFRVISDNNIDVSLRSKLTLEIDLPSGIDTVTETASVPLTYNGTSTGSADTNDVFDGSYVFHKEDTVNFSDGFAYLSVKLPLRIQRNLPLTFQVSSDGTPFVISLPTPTDGGVIAEFSIDTNVVQPITAKSVQGSEAQSGKNKKSVRKPKA